MTTAAANNLAACHLCYKLAPVTVHQCPRCGSAMHLRKSDSIQRTLALLVTACLLYIPANLYPIMYTDQLGKTEASTILGGVILLIDLGSAPIAAVIFIFSVMVPSGKLMAMFYLVWTVERHSPLDPRQRSVMYRVTEFIGKWSMVDVFVVAISGGTGASWWSIGHQTGHRGPVIRGCSNRNHDCGGEFRLAPDLGQYGR